MSYTLIGQKCGTVRFEPIDNGTITSESLSRSSKVTTNPIEDGSDINDHVVKSPESYAITGVVVGGSNAAAKLKAMWEKRDILTYTGRSRFTNMVITSYKEDVNSKNADGFSFSITLQKVTITSAVYVPVGETPLMSQQDAGKPTSPDLARSCRATQQAGLTTTMSTTISSSAYNEKYVAAYNNKPASSNGPTTRNSPSYNGVK